MPRLFISHSSKDGEMAALLVDLLRSALNVRAEDIRCTSVEGHGLPGGQETDQALREEIRKCEAFIGLISSTSVESAYVLFELGARWGTERHLLPLLAPNADPGLLRGPLAGINALNSSSAADLHQMIHELGGILTLKPESPAVYQRRVDEILSLVARSIVMATPDIVSDERVNPSRSVTGQVDEFPDALATIQEHCEREWPDDFSMREYCIEQQEQALAELQRGRPADIPDEIFNTIRRKCTMEWPDDFVMRQYCEEEQYKAYRKGRARRGGG